MKVIRIPEAGVFADERGNIIPDNEFFDYFSHEGDYLSIRTRIQCAGVVPAYSFYCSARTHPEISFALADGGRWRL